MSENKKPQRTENKISEPVFDVKLKVSHNKIGKDCYSLVNISKYEDDKYVICTIHYVCLKTYSSSEDKIKTRISERIRKSIPLRRQTHYETQRMHPIPNRCVFTHELVFCNEISCAHIDPKNSLLKKLFGLEC